MGWNYFNSINLPQGSARGGQIYSHSQSGFILTTKNTRQTERERERVGGPSREQKFQGQTERGRAGGCVIFQFQMVCDMFVLGQ